MLVRQQLRTQRLALLGEPRPEPAAGGGARRAAPAGGGRADDEVEAAAAAVAMGAIDELDSQVER